MNSELSSAEKYAELFQIDKPSNYERDQDILYHLTYLDRNKNGEVVRKKLKGDAISLFFRVKKYAGKKGIAWPGVRTLAKDLGFSISHISKLKSICSRPMEQMGWTPLFTIKKKKKLHEGSTGATLKDYMTINPKIWNYNRAHLGTMEFQSEPKLGPLNKGDPLIQMYEEWEKAHIKSKKTRKTRKDSLRARSQKDPDVQTISPRDTASPHTRSQCGHNNRDNKTYSVKETDLNVKPLPVCNSKNIGSVIEEQLSLNMQSRKQRSHDYMLQHLGCDQNFVNEMSKKYDINRISNAIHYVYMQMKHGKRIEVPAAYLRKAIVGGWQWEDRAASKT